MNQNDQVLWLKAGLVGDDTDGHIDNLARFFKADGMLLAEAGDPANPNLDRLEENARRIAAMRTPGGRPYELRRLPVPDPIYDDGGDILAASYLNFIVLNGAVLVPTSRGTVKNRRFKSKKLCLAKKQLK